MSLGEVNISVNICGFCSSSSVVTIVANELIYCEVGLFS